MSNKRITKTFLKRLGGLILIIAAICLILGYCIAPSRPYPRAASSGSMPAWLNAALRADRSLPAGALAPPR
jgi:hypothetical protein